jgi:hypothetical protein
MIRVKLALRVVVAAAPLVTVPDIAMADNFAEAHRWMAHRFQRAAGSFQTPHAPVSVQRHHPVKRVVVHPRATRLSHRRTPVLSRIHASHANSASRLVRSTLNRHRTVVIYLPVIERVYIVDRR